MGRKMAVPVSVAVVLSVLAIQASALELNYYGINADIGSNLVTYFDVTMITNGTLNSMDYALDFRVENLTVATSSGTSRCSSERAGIGSKVTCDFYGMNEGEENTVRMSFMTMDGVKRNGDQYEFRTAFPVEMPIQQMFATVKLPPKSTLASDVANESYFPPNGRVITDGRRIIVTWQREMLSPNDAMSFSVIFEIIGAGGTFWDMTIVAMVAVVVIAMAGIAFYMRKGSGNSAPAEIKVLPLLNKDEKSIVDIVARKGGSARQRDVVKEADFSKAKVSRLVKNLKERGVLDVEALSGRENKLILKIKGVVAG